MDSKQLQHIRTLLESSLEQLEQDLETNQRLQKARMKAMSHYRQPWTARHRPVLGLAVAATLVLILMLPYWFRGSDTHSIQAPNFDDIELLTDLDLFEQDLDFYIWLEETEQDEG
jgi:hypothetical protein